MPGVSNAMPIFWVRFMARMLTPVGHGADCRSAASA
jgi:hypothetical protein